jgi:hypothetical protein
VMNLKSNFVELFLIYVRIRKLFFFNLAYKCSKYIYTHTHTHLIYYLFTRCIWGYKNKWLRCLMRRVGMMLDSTIRIQALQQH